MATAILNKFNGGMTADKNDSATYSQLCKHFDNFTTPHSLIPYYGSTEITTIASSTELLHKIKKFLVYNSTLYALGEKEDESNKQQVFSNNFANQTYTAVANAVDSAAGENNGLFVEYKGTLWGDAGGTRLWSHVLSGNTFTSSAQAVTYTTITQGLVHSKDDILYFGYTNSTATYIASKNGVGAWNLTALTMPTNLVVVSLCEYGNYLAIACAPAQIGGNSVVFLWDRDSTLTTLSESINLGNASVKVLENIDGYLIAVSTIGGLTSTIKSKMVFSKYGGGGFIVFKELPVSTDCSVITGMKQKINNRLYFAVAGTSSGGTSNDYTGIWSVGRNGETEPFSVNFIQKPRNDTVVNNIYGFILVNDYFYIVSSSATTPVNGYIFTQTSSSSWGATAVYRTVINPNMPDVDSVRKKQLIAITLLYDAIPSGGQVVLKYAVDGGSLTTVFTDTTENSVSFEMSSANGVQFTAGRDYEFQFESKGVEITGFAYQYRTIETHT